MGAAFKAFRGGEEAAIDAEITALNTAIASASGADKIAKEAEKATKEQKKKLKAREIEYTYTKSKQDAGRKNALAGVKAKMEDAKSKNIDTTSATFTEETRAMAKRAFKASMAVADIEDTEMEELLKETSKKEASDQLDSCYETVQQDSTKGASYLSSCQKEAMATARDARMPKKGSIEDLETEAERDVSFKKMMNEIAQEKASGTMAAAMRAKPDMTEREKLDTVKIEMKKSLATTEDISDSKIKDFIKKGAVKKVREVAKTAKGATKKETRDSVQAAMKESLGKPDKLVGGVYVSQVTETDAELFLEEAAIDEVDSVMSSCVESGDKLANGYDATTALGDCETKAKAASKAFRGGEEAALDTEINGVDSAINTYTTDITALENTIATMPTSTEEEKTLKATKVAEKDAKVTAKASKEKEKVTKQEKKKLKTREIEYTYTKSKQDAGRKNALAKVKAKMEDAKSKNIDMNTVAFKNEKRAMAKDAFKASMAVDTIEDVEMEKLLIETSKKEASDQLDAAYEIAQSATTDADIRTAFPGAGAKIEASKTALDDANTKLDTEIA